MLDRSTDLGVAAQAVESLLSLLRCPACAGPLQERGGDVRCVPCGTAYPIVDGVVRFVADPEEELARRTQSSFGYEWSVFNDWQTSGVTNFHQYFGDLDLETVRGSTVLDAGCGMGRHARQMAAYAAHVVAMDFSRAVDAARCNTRELGNVCCVQGDIMAPPLADDAFDFVYSLGVLHHLADTEAAARRLVAKVKPGGRFRLYLYWRREGVAGAVLRLVSIVRRVTTRMPFPVLRALCWVLSVALFVGVVLPYRFLRALGVRRVDTWPLGVYVRYPFGILYNDQFDRFSAPLEQRWSREEVARLLERIGLERIRVWPSAGWIGEGWRSPAPDVSR